MPQRPVIILITGAPASGKTSLATYLAQELCLPMVSRDQLKEIMFDSIGWKNRKQSQLIGSTAYRLMDHLIVTELEANKSLIIESNFLPANDSARFQAWQKTYHFSCIQLVCSAKHDILVERFKQRAKTGARHPGHTDTQNYKNLSKVLLESPSLPLDLKSKVIEVETSDFSQIEYAKIVAQLRKVVGS